MTTPQLAMLLAIRRAEPADCPALSHIARSAKAHWGYPDDWLELWRDELEFTQASLERHAVFCAVRAREIIGVYALSLTGREAELEDLWVLHDSHCCCSPSW